MHLLPTRKETRTLDLKDGATVETAVRALGLLPDSWIAVRSGQPLPSDEPLAEDDDIRLISAVSGG